MKMENENLQYVSITRNYEGVSNAKPFFHTDVRASLENIVDREEPKHEEGVFERVFSGKGKSLKATLKALSNEIILREKLDLHLLNKIDEDMIKQQSQLDQLKSLRVHYVPELQKEITSQKIQLENNVLELEKEKRKEYLECWKDLMSLKTYLLIALKDFWDVSKRRGVLGGDVDERS